MLFQVLAIRSAGGLYAVRMYIGHRGARRDVRIGLVEGVSIVLGEGVGPSLSKSGTRITTMPITGEGVGPPLSENGTRTTRMPTRGPSDVHARAMTMN